MREPNPQTQQLREFRRIIGRNIQHFRMQRNMTIRSLARKAGVSHGRLDKYELGRDDIRIEEVSQLAEILKINVKRFFYE